VNLNRLRYFLAVADELHFGRAAAKLHMAQPPLSRQIRQLESELGVVLFSRSTRNVTLTEAGKFLYPEAQRLVVHSESLERRMQAVRSGDGGVLRLGFVDSSSYEVMPRFLRAYRKRWPAVDYQLRSLSSDDQHEALIGGQIDLGIGRTAGPGNQLGTTKFLEERLVIAVGADHPLADKAGVQIKDLEGEPIIGFDRGRSPSLHAEMRALFQARGVGFDPVIEATEYTTILGLVAAGEGVAIVPAGVRTFRPPNLRYVDLTDPDATSSLMLLRRKDEADPLVERAAELVITTFR